MSTPNVGAPEWGAAQASPWIPVNQALRIFDAFAGYAQIEDRDLNAPPGSSNDGGRYLVAGSATGAWAGHSGDLAISSGVNASNGWLFAEIGLEGAFLWVRDEAIGIRYLSGAWHSVPDPIFRLQDLLDVDETGLADGAVPVWDQSNGQFYMLVPANSVRPIPFMFTGTSPIANEILALYPVIEKLTLPANCAGSRVSLVAAATAQFVINIQKQTNGTGAFSTVGSLTINPDLSYAFVTSGGTAVTFQSGDVLKCIGDSDGDASLQGAATLRLLIG